jgi:murein DD-endopeptidase
VQLSPSPRRPRAGLPGLVAHGLVAHGRRRLRPLAARLARQAWVVLVAAILAITSLGLTRPGVARAAVAASSTVQRVKQTAWRYALRQHGKPYEWGGTGPRGFDCSGLVYASYRSAGIRLPRTTYEMLHSRRLVRVAKPYARRGDLAFFGTGHVELYDWGPWTYGAADSGSRIGFHRMNRFWHPTMYFRIRR